MTLIEVPKFHSMAFCGYQVLFSISFFYADNFLDLYYLMKHKDTFGHLREHVNNKMDFQLPSQ
jgi:hypothetical protein